MSTPLPVLQPSLGLSGIDRVLDNTAVSTYQTCPREYYFSMVLHRRSSEVGHAPLVYGRVWHKILEVHYRTGGDESAVFEAALVCWDQGHGAVGDHRTLERALLDYRKYAQKYGAADIAETVGYPDNPLVELPINCQGEGLIHPYAGKIDRLVRIGKQIYVEDHKTTSRLDKYYFTGFDLSSQMLGYTYLAQQLMPGETVAGVRINVAHVLKDSTVFPERQLFTFSPDRIAEWVRNTNIWMSRINGEMEWMEENGGVQDTAFPGHYGTNGCDRKFGLCQYHRVCSVSPRIRQRALEAEFPETTPWNPLAVEDE